jgi:hypothetical protein
VEVYNEELIVNENRKETKLKRTQRLACEVDAHDCKKKIRCSSWPCSETIYCAMDAGI